LSIGRYNISVEEVAVGGAKVMLYAATRALLWAGGVAVFIALSCGDPTPAYREHEWREVADFPPNAESINRLAEAGDGSVYVAASCRDEEMNYRPVVYRWAGGKVVEAFRGPYKDGEFADVACRAGYVWVGGTKLVAPEKLRPYLVRYDGARWEEITVPKTVNSLGVYGLYPVSGDACWVCAYDGVYIYRRGAWEKKLAFSERSYYFFTVTPAGRAAVYKYSGAAEPEIYISDDGGATWAAERPGLDNKHFTLHSNQPAAFTSCGERVCWAARLRPAGSEGQWDAFYFAVIMRDEASAGQGSYETVFLAPRGPYLTNIADMAFRDASKGYAVGTFTSLAYRDGEWIFQTLPESWHPHFDHVAAGRSSFWALASRYGGRPVKLYQAP
jgi:hypothetical protein